MKPENLRDEYRVRRWFFIIVEILLALSWCGLFAAFRWPSMPEPLVSVCLWTRIITIALLLFVLPWFWSSLRTVALIGWLMAAASVVFMLFATIPGSR